MQRWIGSGGFLLITAACLAWAGLLVLSGAEYCLAQGSAAEEELKGEIGKIDAEAGKDASKVEEAIQGQFGVQPEEIQSLLKEKVGYGDMAALLAASATSGKARQEILGLLKSGKNWAEIAGNIGSDLEVVLAQVQEVSKKVSGEATAKPKRKMKFAPGT
ncbi:MAG: hypothetical protein QHH30_04165 [candidate division NC10 bacterium]|nr:hypothetical protein [candidate division NC10 bacterium]